MVEASVHIDLKGVVIAGTPREPRPGVCDIGICPGGGWNIKRARRNRSTRQSCRKRSRICGGAGRRWTDDRKWLVGVKADEFMVAMTSNVAYGQRCVGRKLLLDTER